ncbi:MAG TPA: hypothetical protein VFR11_20620 [Micromonosporaceae bacterium]|nr:hypothetical protein [Micromonosporaceae bacterium]
MTLASGPVRELPQPGDVLHLSRTNEPLLVCERVGEGGQGVVHRATMSGGAQLALKWYRPHTHSRAQYESIERLASRPAPHPSFMFPLDTVRAAHLTAFGYVMPWLDPKYMSFASYLNEPRAPGLKAKATIGRKLAEAFSALHTSGLCYRDINFGNLWVDPVRADVAIIDNDNVGTDDGPVTVLGALRFMAPEVIRRQARPSTVSDLHSLAVLLFYLLMHGHPLDGARLEASMSWETGRHRTDEQLARKHYGDEPVFVFDPADVSNRPTVEAGPASWWPVYAGFVRRRFEHAFTVGLRDASLSGRVLAGTWRDTLARMYDLCMVCEHCRAALVFDTDSPDRPCWHCGRVPRRPNVIDVPRSRCTLVLVDGARLNRHHVSNDRDYDTAIGVVATDPATGRLALRNVSTTRWLAQATGGSATTVEPGQWLAIRGATVDFGEATGEIRIP